MTTKLSLTKLGGNKTQKAPSDKYIVVKDLRTQVAEWRETKKKFDAVEGIMKQQTEALREAAIEPFFTQNEGKAIPQTGVMFEGEELHESALITFTKRYGTFDPSEVKAVVGEKIVEEHFYEKLSIKIDGDKIPADKQQAVIDKLAKLFSDLGCGDAIEAKVVISPREEFHTSRHTLLTAKQNILLQKGVAKCTTQAKEYKA